MTDWQAELEEKSLNNISKCQSMTSPRSAATVVLTWTITMNRNHLFTWLLICSSLAGCHDASNSLVTNRETPITIEAWKELGVNEKYELETFDRLKMSYPKLNDERIWEQFMQTVVVPERRQDIPTSY